MSIVHEDLKLGSIHTGEYVNSLNLIFAIYLSKDMTYLDHTYKIGLNVKTSEECTAGGFSFTTNNLLYRFVDHGPNTYRVSIPDDACVLVEVDKLKTDKLFLHEITDWNDVYPNLTVRVLPSSDP